jgi:hypothetical protein
MSEPKPVEKREVKKLEFKSEYSADEWAEILCIPEKTFMKLISEAKIEKSSEVDGVPQYKQGDVMKYIVLKKKISLYINYFLYFFGDRGMSVGDLHEAFLGDYKFYSHEEFRDRFGEDASEKIRMRIYDILRKKVRRGTLVKVIRDRKPVYILPQYATPEQKKEQEDRRNALRIIFFFNPASKSIRSTIPPKKKLTDDEKIAFLAIRTYADTMLWLDEKYSQNDSKQ